MYRIEYRREPMKMLERMPKNTAALIDKKLEALCADPFAAPNVRKLTGRSGYRLRVGDWRVIYEIEGAVLVIHVLTIAPRSRAYQ